MWNNRGKHRHPYKKRPLVDSNAQKPTEDLSTPSQLEANPVFDRTKIQTENRCGIEKTHDGSSSKGSNGNKATLESPSTKTATGLTKTCEEICPLVETGNKASPEEQHSIQHKTIHKGPSIMATAAYDISQFETRRQYESANVRDLSPPIEISDEEAGVDEGCEAREVNLEDCTVQNDRIPDIIDLTDESSEDSTGDFTEGNQMTDSEDDRHKAEYNVFDDQNNNLPNGWAVIPHESGVPIYWNEELKAIVAAPPYTVGPDSVRQHRVPKTAIPCLARRLRATEESLSLDDLRAYLERRFRFRTSRSVHHGSWKKKRAYDSIVRRYGLARLPGSVQLHTGRTGALVPYSVANKTHKMFLTEYVGLAACAAVDYDTQPAERQGVAFAAAACVGGARYGRGAGSSKKAAREAAARHALDVVLPNFRGPKAADPFERLPVADARVPRACRLLCLPQPTAVLRAAIDAHDDLRGLPVEEDVVVENGRAVFQARVGPHAARVRCRGKTDGRQRAAQSLLAQIHPLVRCWAGLMRLYDDVVSVFEVDLAESEVDSPADRSLMERLRRAMLAMAGREERRESVEGEFEQRDWEDGDEQIQMDVVLRLVQESRENDDGGWVVRKDLLFPAGPFHYTPPAHFHQCDEEMQAPESAQSTDSLHEPTDQPTPPAHFDQCYEEMQAPESPHSTDSLHEPTAQPDPSDDPALSL